MRPVAISLNRGRVMRRSGRRCRAIWSTGRVRSRLTAGQRPSWPATRHPIIRLAEGTSTIAGRFPWSKRPETLSVPDQTGLVSLAVDSHRVDEVDRADGAVWLGKQ